MATELKQMNPFIGPRPFERSDKKYFFGRKQEVNDLISSIIAHRVVLLYAQSGAGKTSLLNAALIPHLEEEGFEVFPIARVRTSIQQKQLPESIGNIFMLNVLMGWSEEADDINRLNKMSFSEFLKNKPQLIGQDKLPLPRLIIFDQFEELFTFYQERWKDREEFFTQVSEALEADPLLRVLFVIREDFLADFDPYIEILPERLRTRYRLERLNYKAAYEAIQRPLEGTGRYFAKGLADILVNKLASIKVKVDKGKTVDAGGEFVEPVLLQVVCRKLWNKLPSETKEITSEDIDEFADITLALQSFYEDALKITQQKTSVKEDKLRSLFEYNLITSFGTRGTVIRGTESTEGIPNSAIDELENQHLIRSEARSGAQWYELTHDRLIETIRKSNENWKRRFERRIKQKRILRYALPASIIIILFYIVLLIDLQSTRMHAIYNFNEMKRLKDSLKIEAMQSQLDTIEVRRIKDSLGLAIEKESAEMKMKEVLNWIKRGQLEAVRNSKDKLDHDIALGSVTSYFMKEKRKTNLDTLISILRKYNDLAGEGYLVDEEFRENFPKVTTATPWPITIIHPDTEEFNEGEFSLWWYRYAKSIARFLGIPTPLRIQFRKNGFLNKDSLIVIVKSGDQDSLIFKFGFSLRDEYVLAIQNQIDSTEFYKKYKSAEWKSVTDTIMYVGWRWVPKWIQPILKKINVPTYSKEIFQVISVLDTMLNNPKSLLTNESVEVLIERLKKKNPQIVDEVLQNRGGTTQFRNDLIALFKKRYWNLKNLQYDIDIISNFNSQIHSNQLIDSLPDDYNESPPNRRETISRTDRINFNQSSSTKSPTSEIKLNPDYLFAYRQAAEYLPLIQDPVRYYTQREKMDKIEIGQKLEDLKISLKSRFGIEIPSINSSYLNGGTSSKDSCSFRIEVLNENQFSSKAKMIDVPVHEGTQRFLEELERRLILYRMQWVTPDFIHEILAKQGGKIKKWINQTYTLTDLKNILRQVIAPTDRERIYDYRNSLEDIYKIIPREHTIGRLPWLLRSLVFWTSAYDPLDYYQMANCLVRTQRARLLRLSNKQISADKVAKLTVEGISYLKKDNIDSAIISFNKAIKIDAASTEEVFLTHYPQDIPEESLSSDIIDRYKLPKPGRIYNYSKPSSEEQYEVESLLGKYGSKMNVSDRRKLQLFLLWDYNSKEGYHSKAKIIIDSLIADSGKIEWLPKDAYIFAYELLEFHGWKMTKPIYRIEIEKLLVSAFKQWEERFARNVFTELMGEYKFGKAPRWYLSILSKIALYFPKSYVIPYYLGSDLAARENVDLLREGLELLNQAEYNLNYMEISNRAWKHDMINYFKSEAFISLASGAAKNYYVYQDSAVALLNISFKSILNYGWSIPNYFYSLLNQAYVVVNELDSAETIIKKALQKLPNNLDLLESKFFLQLALFQPDSALAVSSSMMKISTTSNDSTSALFTSAFAQILTNDPKAEYTARQFMYNTEHEYRDYIRMMLYWMLKSKGQNEKAQKYIDERWKNIHPSEWQERANEGDNMVWREMLIGYYKQNKQSQIFSWLSDRSSYESSPLFNLDYSYEGLCCEAYFYDALFQLANGESGDRLKLVQNRLNKVISLKYYSYYEYQMARYLLGTISNH